MSRRRVDELMDAPALQTHLHEAALHALRRINRVSGIARRLLPEVLALAKAKGMQRLTLLDVACGGGDVPIALAHLCELQSVKLELILADRSPTALAHAAVGATGLSFTTQQCDATRDDLPRADIVTNSLFLHHLDAPDVVCVLKQMASRTRHLLLVNDLRRSRLAWAVTRIACRLLTRSPIVHFDGPASVRGAWTIDEIRAFAAEAGMASAEITGCWPWRMLLKWKNQ